MSKIVVGRVQDGKVLHSFKGPQGDKVEMDSLAFTGDSNKLWIGVTPNIHVQAVNGEQQEIRSRPRPIRRPYRPR